MEVGLSMLCMWKLAYMRSLLTQEAQFHFQTSPSQKLEIRMPNGGRAFDVVHVERAYMRSQLTEEAQIHFQTSPNQKLEIQILSGGRTLDAVHVGKGLHEVATH